MWRIICFVLYFLLCAHVCAVECTGVGVRGGLQESVLSFCRVHPGLKPSHEVGAGAFTY